MLDEKTGLFSLEIYDSLSLFNLLYKHTQVSVLTDQVEAQGEKIRDLENSLEEHQLKLNSTEEMLQQVQQIFLFTASQMQMCKNVR